MPSNFSKPSEWDWDTIVRVILAMLAVFLSGMLLALLGGYLFVRVIMESIFL